MATSSITGGDRASRRPSGTDLASLGPSDSSDSGSDSLGARDLTQCLSDSDATGTGESSSDPTVPHVDAADILPDHLVQGRKALESLWSEEEQTEARDDVSLEDFADARSAFDVPGSALDNPDLMDTTADAAELAQDLDGEDDSSPAEGSQPISRPASVLDQPAGIRPLPGHRGLQ